MPASRYHYGELPNAPEGTTFRYRDDLREQGVHRPPMGGISGSATEAAESIVVSGGYEDDQDLGHEIIYTGQGGNDPKTGKQIANQELVRGNMGLVLAWRAGTPVRVIRGANPSSPFAPAWGYRYDGLFYVDDYWQETGKSGFRVWRFRLRKISGQPSAPKATPVTTVAPSVREGLAPQKQPPGDPLRPQASVSSSPPEPQKGPSLPPKRVIRINETRVRHSAFGEGTVIGMNDGGGTTTISVRFDDVAVGEKKLDASHSAITFVG